MNKGYIHIIFSLAVFIPLFITAVVLTPGKADAISLTSPFGGRVQSPPMPGCPEVTAAISIATGGSINVTIEILKVGPPKGGTFGILRVNGFLVPGLTKIYKHKAYQIPGNWVLGNSFDLCAGGLGNVGGEIVGMICDAAGESCPINNLVHKMGTSLIPSF